MKHLKQAAERPVAGVDVQAQATLRLVDTDARSEVSWQRLSAEQAITIATLSELLDAVDAESAGQLLCASLTRRFDARRVTLMRRRATGSVVTSTIGVPEGLSTHTETTPVSSSLGEALRYIARADEVLAWPSTGARDSSMAVALARCLEAEASSGTSPSLLGVPLFHRHQRYGALLLEWAPTELPAPDVQQLVGEVACLAVPILVLFDQAVSPTHLAA